MDFLVIFGKVWKCAKWTISVNLEIIFGFIFNICHSTL